MSNETTRRTGWMLLAILPVAAAAILFLWIADETPTGGAPGPTPATHEQPTAVALPVAPAGEPVPMELPGIEVETPEDEVEWIEVTLPMRASARPEASPREVTLLVVDDAGTPIPDARVELWADLESLDERLGPERTTWTDGQGRALLESPSDDAMLLAVRDDVGSTGVWSGERLQRARDAAGRSVVTLLPRAHLRGRVVQSDDSPVPGAHVAFMRTAFFQGVGRVPEPMAADGDGRFETWIDARARLRAFALADEASHPVTVEAAPGAELEIELRFAGRWTLGGILQDAEGEPVADGTVTLWRHFSRVDVDRGELPGEEPYRRRTSTSEDGSFVFDLPRAGEYTLVGSNDTTAPSDPEVVRVDDFLPHATVTLRLPAPGRIGGLLVQANGLPLPGVLVHARPAHLYSPQAMEYAPTVWGRYGQASQETDEEGRFLLEPLHPEGVYIVYCKPEDDRPDRKLVVKGVRTGIDDLLLVASDENLRRAFVEGTVVSDETGQSLAEFFPTLVIRLDGRVIDTDQPAVHSPDGFFRIEGLAPGYEYRLRVDAPGHGAIELPWFTADRRGHRFPVRLPGAGGLEVTVVDGRGRPAALAEVLLRRRSQDFAIDSPRSARTDETGRALFPDLPPGVYAVEARQGARQADAEVQVDEGDPSRARVRLDG